jgi:tripartite ATP-independent transporter DctM subunit
MADRYNLPKAERIVSTGQDISTVEYWVSFALLRINLGGILLAVYSGLSGLVGLSFENEAGDTVHRLNLWIVFAAMLVLAHLFLMSYREKVSHDFRMVCKKAVAPLQTPIIILGGILVGVFTPTEASAVAVFYALIVSFFVLRSMKMKDLGAVLTRSALATSAVLLLVGAAVAFKTVVSLSYAPQILSDYILSLSENPLMLLFLINILLFIVGMFLDAGPAIIILGPILGPIFLDLGVHPVHFAIIMSVNLTVGLATPPMGLVLFVASSVSGERVEAIARAILPFLAVQVAVIFLITYVPAISMTVPYLAGFLGCGPEVGFSACISPEPGVN